MTIIITIVIVYVLSLFVLLFVISATKGIWKTILISLLTGISLTYLTLLEFNQRPLFLSEEANAIELVIGLDQHTMDFDSAMQNEEIILVDVSAHTQLIGLPQKVFDDSTAKQAITDRDKLARFFNWLGKDSINKYLGVVVCDILLENNTQYDDTLRAAMRRLIDKDQLLFAKHQGMNQDQLTWWFGTDTVARSVDIVEYDGMYFSHSLRDVNGSPSLPYALYLRHMNRLRSGDDLGHRSRAKLFKENDEPSGSPKWVSNWFIPDLILNEEATNGVPVSEPKTVFSTLKNSVNDFFFGDLNQNVSLFSYKLFPIGLGASTQEGGQQYLKNTFQAAKDSGKRVTIFIGSFSDDRDMHETAFGRMHGGLIILNIYLNLIAGQHWIDIYHIIFLFIFFSIIAWRLIHRIQLLNGKEHGRFVKWIEKLHQNEKIKKMNKNWVYRLISFFVIEFILNPWHYWLLLVMLLISVICFHRMVNVMPVAIVLASVDITILALKQAFFSDPPTRCDFVKSEKNDANKNIQ